MKQNHWKGSFPIVIFQGQRKVETIFFIFIKTFTIRSWPRQPPGKNEGTYIYFFKKTRKTRHKGQIFYIYL
jgi:hypothetical protein